MEVSLVVSISAVTISLVSLIVGYFQFKKQINRNLYERRLSEVYAPLMYHLIMQEEFRYLLSLQNNNADFKEHPFINIANKKIENIQYEGGETVQSEEWTTILSNEAIPELVEKKSIGLARPTLLKYSAAYKLYLGLKDKNGINKYGRLLLKEIVEGYEETINKLNMGDNDITFEYDYIKRQDKDRK